LTVAQFTSAGISPISVPSTEASESKEEAMVAQRTRREFLADVGRGMLLAGLGASLAADLELSPAWADQVLPSTLEFGSLEPLVALMQETPPAKLTALLVERLKSGTDLRTLTAAGALANARTFGGEDYVGFHTFMALAPAYRMAKELPLNQQPLPVLKVLYRNANRIQEFGGRKNGNDFFAREFWRFVLVQKKVARRTKTTWTATTRSTCLKAKATRSVTSSFTSQVANAIVHLRDAGLFQAIVGFVVLHRSVFLTCVQRERLIETTA
jgi:hypothetical protein